MSTGDRLGWVGLIVALLGIAVAVLWPSQRWIGWVCLAAAGLLGVGWVWHELRSQIIAAYEVYPPWPLIGTCVVVTLIVSAALRFNPRESTVPPSPPQHVYDLSGDRRVKFEEALKNQADPRAIIRVGCDAQSEETCVVAGQFLFAISEAGWTIDSKEVFRLRPQIPIAGVAMASRDLKVAEEAKKLPPHLGAWHKMSPSEVTFYWALRGLDIPINASTDNSLP
jgi:hypothetical protein